MSKDFHGVIPALLSPFRVDGRVDTDAIIALVDFLIDKGVHGLYPCGTTGEGMLLNSTERKEVAEAVVDAANGRVPVMVHVGSFSTTETVELAQHARSIGADAIGVVAPYFYKFDATGLLTHYRRVAEAVPDLPLYIYNLPANSRNDISPALAKEIASYCPSVAGVKDSSKDVARLQDYISVLGEGYRVIVGSDVLFLPALAVGGVGVISAVANVFPELMVRLYKAYTDEDLETARRLQYQVNQVRDILKQGPYLARFKAAVSLRGISFGGIKAPLRGLEYQEVDELRKELAELSLL
ncbi:MAG: dihydrodipicolinate synthase family protein [Firmicutes bacterium]|nr:dihydrodipicolinate synthase family protein [Bacillota bacterium]